MIPPVGLLKIGTVRKTRQNYIGTAGINTVDVKVGHSAGSPIYTSDLHFTYADNNGVFIGALPPEGNPVLVLQEQGNKHQAISYYPSDPSILPDLKPGQLLLKNNDYTRINFKNYNIILGDNSGKGLVLDTGADIPDYSSFNNNFDYHFNFSQGLSSVSGVVKREVKETQYTDELKLVEDYFFKYKTTPISFNTSYILNKTDNSEQPNVKINNPFFIENRSVVYEFQRNDNVSDLESELGIFSQKSPSFPLSDRHKSRADILGLSLHAPNYLIETVKGNVIDIYGNLLDLNRYPIKTNLDALNQENIQKNFLKIKEDQRRGLAFHFELNAKKDLGETGKAPNVQVTDNYSRNRSRFFIDVDKEGQFKINIPASSEAGNIPLLTRYENYNTVEAAKNSEIHPNELLYSKDQIDILHDSFAAGISEINLNYSSQKDKIQEAGNYNRGLISIIKGGVDGSPIDRISKDLNADQPSHIRHGTAYHDILSTCISHQNEALVNYLYFGSQADKDKWQTIFKAKAIENPVASNTIEIGKNAGGRSGSINLDGSMELNVGANTIDRQSLWLDTAGGMVANFGKDRNNISAAISMDGDLLINVGGKGIPKNQDSRFSDLDADYYSGAVDIRVQVEGNRSAVIRIDKNGITLMSPKGIFLKSNGAIDITSNSTINIDAESVKIQGRIVEKPIYSSSYTI